MNRMKMSKQNKPTKRITEVAKTVRRSAKPAVSAPKIKPKVDGSVEIVRTEYVTAVVSANMSLTQFSNTLYPINPGLHIFPWLSQVADNWCKYKFKRIRFHYKPVVSSANLTGAMGSILLAFNVNAADPKFSSFASMVEYSGSVEKRICDEIWFSLDTRGIGSNDGSLFIRTGEVDGQDIKTYDLGSLQIAQDHISTSAYPEGTLLGHLYVEYDVELIRPRIRVNPITYQPKTFIARSTAIWASDTDIVSYADVLNSNNIGVALVAISSEGFVGFEIHLPTLEPTAYHVLMYATTSNSMTYTPESGINSLAKSGIYGDAAYYSFVDGGAPTNIMFESAVETTGEPNAVMRFSWVYTAHFGYYIVISEISTSPNVGWTQYS